MPSDFYSRRRSLPSSNLIWPDKDNLHQYKLFDMRNTTVISNNDKRRRNNSAINRTDLNEFLQKLTQKTEQIFQNGNRGGCDRSGDYEGGKAHMKESPICCSTPSPIKRIPELTSSNHVNNKRSAYVTPPKKHSVIHESFNRDRRQDQAQANVHRPTRNYAYNSYEEETMDDYTSVTPPTPPPPSKPRQRSSHSVIRSNRGDNIDKYYDRYDNYDKSPTYPLYDKKTELSNYSNFSKKFSDKYKSKREIPNHHHNQQEHFQHNNHYYQHQHQRYKQSKDSTNFSKYSNPNDSVLVEKLKKMILDIHSNSTPPPRAAPAPQAVASTAIPAFYLPITNQQQQQPTALMTSINSTPAAVVAPPTPPQQQPSSQPVINIYPDQKKSLNSSKSSNNNVNPAVFDPSPLINKLQDLISKMPVQSASNNNNNNNSNNNSENSNTLLSSKLQDMIEKIHKEFVENKDKNKKSNDSNSIGLSDMNMFQNQFMFPPSFMPTLMNGFAAANLSLADQNMANNLLQQMASQMLHNQQQDHRFNSMRMLPPQPPPMPPQHSAMNRHIPPMRMSHHAPAMPSSHRAMQPAVPYGHGGRRACLRHPSGYNNHRGSYAF